MLFSPFHWHGACIVISFHFHVVNISHLCTNFSFGIFATGFHPYILMLKKDVDVEDQNQPIFQSFSQYFLIFFSLSVALSPKFIASYLSSKCVSDLLCPLSFLTGLATADWSIRRVVLSYLNALNLHWPQKILQLSSPTPMSFFFPFLSLFFGFFCWVHTLTYKLPIQCLMQPNDRGQEVKTMSLAAAVKQRKE